MLSEYCKISEVTCNFMSLAGLKVDLLQQVVAMWSNKRNNCYSFSDWFLPVSSLILGVEEG